MASVSFKKDIMPFFAQYRGQMLWRLDVTDYEDVRANAKLILGRIDPASGDNRMPPPPFPPFSGELYTRFYQWIDEGFPP